MLKWKYDTPAPTYAGWVCVKLDEDVMRVLPSFNCTKNGYEKSQNEICTQTHTHTCTSLVDEEDLLEEYRVPCFLQKSG